MDFFKFCINSNVLSEASHTDCVTLWTHILIWAAEGYAAFHALFCILSKMILFVIVLRHIHQIYSVLLICKHGEKQYFHIPPQIYGVQIAKGILLHAEKLLSLIRQMMQQQMIAGSWRNGVGKIWVDIVLGNELGPKGVSPITVSKNMHVHF